MTSGPPAAEFQQSVCMLGKSMRLKARVARVGTKTFSFLRRSHGALDTWKEKIRFPPDNGSAGNICVVDLYLAKSALSSQSAICLPRNLCLIIRNCRACNEICIQACEVSRLPCTRHITLRKCSGCLPQTSRPFTGVWVPSCSQNAQTRELVRFFGFHMKP